MVDVVVVGGIVVVVVVEVVDVVDVVDDVVVVGIVVVVVELVDVVVVVRRGLLAGPAPCDSRVLRMASQAADPFCGAAQLWTRAEADDPPAATDAFGLA